MSFVTTAPCRMSTTPNRPSALPTTRRGLFLPGCMKRTVFVMTSVAANLPDLFGPLTVAPFVIVKRSASVSVTVP